MKPSVYIETFGCQMNVADTERAATRLSEAGYHLAETEDAADVVIFNTCSVRARAEQKVFTRIGEVRSYRKGREPLIGVMGCVAQLEGATIFDHAPSVNMVIGTRATDRLPALIERAMGGERRTLDLGERDAEDNWNVSTVERHSPYVAFVPIIEGCNKFCTYCIVPYSRGRERSRRVYEIVREVKRLRDEGYREVHLIGQNVNSYRPKSLEGLEDYQGATPFSRLLRAVAATGMERIKFTTSFPRDFHTDIVAAMEEHWNLCDWVHLPVQSGSDRILRAMRRGHKVSDYLRRVEAIKNAGRRIALTTDIIVGFPGETEEDFEDTMRLVEACQYDSAYIFKYSTRPGTPASKLSDDVTGAEKTARFLALERLQREIQRGIYANYVGREVSVLVEGESAKSAEDMTGHSSCHKVVNFKGNKELAGKVVRVRILEAKTNSLYGEMVTGAKAHTA
ncbi:MAG: tRNA (N6-isopentenyl adenosine(37)-C2)-methylthiotransferase MiaB [Pyrinomonadaceae bacterium]|nr:tRNA (N6-isopentenyl adenosine(37)-C2)-methylthiotransferase MiaB [Pyrinomonadaceae bacterium]